MQSRQATGPSCARPGRVQSSRPPQSTKTMPHLSTLRLWGFFLNVGCRCSIGRLFRPWWLWPGWPQASSTRWASPSSGPKCNCWRNSEAGSRTKTVRCCGSLRLSWLVGDELEPNTAVMSSGVRLQHFWRLLNKAPPRSAQCSSSREVNMLQSLSEEEDRCEGETCRSLVDAKGRNSPTHLA